MIQQVKAFIRSYLLPDSLFLYAQTRDEKALYLTFDDGPVSGITEPLLDLLKKYNVKATFFILGSSAEKAPDLMLRIHNEGHAIGNHSYNHPNFSKISNEIQREEIISTNRIIWQTTHQPCHLFRAPQGRWNIKLLYFLWQEKITAIHWSRDSMDFLKEPANQIAERFLTLPVQSGDIILFHDDDERCIDALSTLIPQWLEQGYRFNALEHKYA